MGLKFGDKTYFTKSEYQKGKYDILNNINLYGNIDMTVFKNFEITTDYEYVWNNKYDYITNTYFIIGLQYNIPLKCNYYIRSAIKFGLICNNRYDEMDLNLDIPGNSSYVSANLLIAKRFNISNLSFEVFSDFSWRFEEVYKPITLCVGTNYIF